MTNANAIIRADCHVRARVLIALVLCTILGVIAFVAGDTYVEQLMTLSTTAPQLAIAKIRHFVVVLASVVMLLALGLTGVLGYLSLQVLRSGQYPPPGMKVLRDTPVQTGSRATRRAVVGMLLAVLALCGGLSASMLLIRAAYDLRLHRTRPLVQTVAVTVKSPYRPSQS
jgi:hypothetical protein